MILDISTLAEPKRLFRCDGCQKTRDYLSTSWSTITTSDGTVFHHCLECRSDKKEYRP